MAQIIGSLVKFIGCMTLIIILEKITARKVKILKRWPICFQATPNKGKFKANNQKAVVKESELFLLIVASNCAKPVIPEEYICPGVQKKFIATETIIPYINALEALITYACLFHICCSSSILYKFLLFVYW
ncbi:hypothetical protein FD11_GL000130 [Ligilactobacillus pobuzihii E100301 = KCTC 13174]|uniref:Uncharacterized protein n=1 Tax=Ligilactobacillus pobuzihii TaxID=449659 RepID=A0A0R2LSS7_9LACO|nr:hypothetical protein FD11_GL000130 [Ligilactobacillus pobuzihii E100301 = KCTC 13174]KRO02704.1 hypothetical protein IV66_GL000130 [Ligilactobacillus pobuzihii]